MSTIVIDIPPETYKRLQEHASKAGRTPQAWTRELLEAALETHKQSQPSTVKEALQAAGRVESLSDTLRRMIIAGVTQEEVRQALTHADGCSLSDIILEQRGPKP